MKEDPDKGKLSQREELSMGNSTGVTYAKKRKIRGGTRQE